MFSRTAGLVGLFLCAAYACVLLGTEFLSRLYGWEIPRDVYVRMWLKFAIWSLFWLTVVRVSRRR